MGSFSFTNWQPTYNLICEQYQVEVGHIAYHYCLMEFTVIGKEKA